MKNLSKFLTLVFLFGVFFPSYNMYADGKKVCVTAEIAKNKLKLNDELVDKLASSKIFEQFYYKLFILGVTASTNLSYKSEQEIATILQSLEKNDLTTAEAYKLVGVSDSAISENFNNKFTKLKEELQKSFPELSIMNKDDGQSVIEKAIIKADLLGKATTLLTKDECYRNAMTANANCQSDGYWWENAIPYVLVACVSSYILCGSIAAYVGAGPAGVVAVVAFLSQAAGYCSAAVFGALGIDRVARFEACKINFETRNEACFRQFGEIDNGAANN